uniref:Uncharacterized protein n=1 Tax=Chromera velia CCMP2878 TaxID=1169474 RepID=A0A0G4FBP9_9ALVE|eukprot:Cvel_16154.t1-p1 / transcript=Cvel_16154.t1 / gene=Cvel_16154 / organism=Chromera_velia_CCMP2878 / gene_product=hypothetical protein / transcript_product=hypothetical protein / location=Cvel_scaffold1230:42285-46912(-) / protein_length=850 / sequence_SO=supercontig / SO=protein_coding / is_pseudo=false
MAAFFSLPLLFYFFYLTGRATGTGGCCASFLSQAGLHDRRGRHCPRSIPFVFAVESLRDSLVACEEEDHQEMDGRLLPSPSPPTPPLPRFPPSQSHPVLSAQREGVSLQRLKNGFQFLHIQRPSDAVSEWHVRLSFAAGTAAEHVSEAAPGTAHAVARGLYDNAQRILTRTVSKTVDLGDADEAEKRAVDLLADGVLEYSLNSDLASLSMSVPEEAVVPALCLLQTSCLFAGVVVQTCLLGSELFAPACRILSLPYRKQCSQIRQRTGGVLDGLESPRVKDITQSLLFSSRSTKNEGEGEEESENEGGVQFGSMERPLFGLKSSIEELHEGQLRAFYDRFWTPSNGLVTVASPDLGLASSVIGSLFGGKEGEGGVGGLSVAGWFPGVSSSAAIAAGGDFVFKAPGAWEGKGEFAGRGSLLQALTAREVLTERKGRGGGSDGILADFVPLCAKHEFAPLHREKRKWAPRLIPPKEQMSEKGEKEKGKGLVIVFPESKADSGGAVREDMSRFTIWIRTPGVREFRSSADALRFRTQLEALADLFGDMNSSWVAEAMRGCAIKASAELQRGGGALKISCTCPAEGIKDAVEIALNVLEAARMAGVDEGDMERAANRGLCREAARSAWSAALCRRLSEDFALTGLVRSTSDLCRPFHESVVALMGGETSENESSVPLSVNEVEEAMELLDWDHPVVSIVPGVRGGKGLGETLRFFFARWQGDTNFDVRVAPKGWKDSFLPMGAALKESLGAAGGEGDETPLFSSSGGERRKGGGRSGLGLGGFRRDVGESFEEEEDLEDSDGFLGSPGRPQTVQEKAKSKREKKFSKRDATSVTGKAKRLKGKKKKGKKPTWKR